MTSTYVDDHIYSVLMCFLRFYHSLATVSSLGKRDLAAVLYIVFGADPSDVFAQLSLMNYFYNNDPWENRAMDKQRQSQRNIMVRSKTFLSLA